MNQGIKDVTGIISGTSDCGKPVTESTPPISTTTTPNPETEKPFTPPDRVCSKVTMVIKVHEKSTRDPIQRAKVTIRSKKVYLGEDIRSVYATHTTDGNGKVTEEGQLFGVYTISVLKVTK